MNMPQSPLILPAVMAPDGSLMISELGSERVTVTFSYNAANEKTAIIAFGGCNQAVITYDASGTQPVTYMLYNPAPTLPEEQSVQNIIGYFAASPMLH